MTTRRRVLLAASILLVAARLAWAQAAAPAEVAAELSDARLRGQGRATFFALHIYDIRLWAGAGFDAAAWQASPLALEIEYARSLDGAKIAARSLAEMRRAGDIDEPKAAAWLAAMTQAFPDVRKGDRISGLYRPESGVRFFVNGNPRSEVRDAEFARRFVGIWLDPATSEPKLRRALLGAGGG